MGRISVIVPVYKVENYLHRCVDSILGQSFADFELILVDDGSPDNCGSICDAYAVKDSRIRVIHQENGGLSAARNAGIDWVFAHSDSQWLTFIDSDDWIHGSFLQILLDAAQKNNCKLSACSFYKTSGADFPEMIIPEAKMLSADDYYCGAAPDDSPAPAWAKLYHRSLFQKLRYPLGKLHEDEFTTYQAVYEAGCVAKVDAKIYAYYVNPGSITQSRWKPARLDALEAFRKQMDFAKQSDNVRLLYRATDSYVWSIYHQLQQLGHQGDLTKEEETYRVTLREELKSILKQGMNGRCYSFNRENLLLYEEIYPLKPLWHTIHSTYSLLKRIKGRQ